MDKLNGTPNAGQLYYNNQAKAQGAGAQGRITEYSGPSDSSSVKPNTCNLDIEKLAEELGMNPQFLSNKINAVIEASNTLGEGTEKPPTQPDSGPVA